MAGMVMRAVPNLVVGYIKYPLKLLPVVTFSLLVECMKSNIVGGEPMYHHHHHLLHHQEFPSMGHSNHPTRATRRD